MAFAISLFSLAAIPPLAGFYAKLTVLAEGITFLHWIAIFAVLASTLSAANYLSLAKQPFLFLSLRKLPQLSRPRLPIIINLPVTFYSSPTITLILSPLFYITLLTPLALHMNLHH